MKILIASSELYPFSKTGGLADMVAALSKSLAELGHKVGVVTPLYKGIRERFPSIKPMDWQMEIPLGSYQVIAHVWTLEQPPGLTLYFIDQPGFYERNNLYQENDKDYPDNAERFIFFAKAITHLARYLPWKPEIVHLHDWQTGLTPLFIHHQSLTEQWDSPPKTCYTIHNLAYQGGFPSLKYFLTNLPWDYFHKEGLEFYGNFNCMKAGLVYADVLTTVSPRYAIEITSPEYGCGLDGVLRRRISKLYGILNGVDYSEWKTTGNSHLKYSYTAQRLLGKAQQKKALQKELGLPLEPKIPLFGNIGRMADQKGMDLLLGAVKEVLQFPIQFVLLGKGSREFEESFVKLARDNPQKVAVQIGYNEGLGHRIEAGCDFYIMPSRFEPCGLNQMYSLKYGAIPIVRATGGLDNSIIDINESFEKPNGIKFFEPTVSALKQAILKAVSLYQSSILLNFYRRNGMSTNFSWQVTASAYVEVYQKAMQ